MTNEYGMELNEYGGITEYSVEIRDLNDGHFIKQIDVLDNYEEAEKLIEEYNDYDSNTEILEIHCIDYDEYGEERAYYLCE